MPDSTELVAHDKTVDQICKDLGADKLIYQELEDLIEAVRYTGATVNDFDCSCFSGEYVTGDVTDSYLKRLKDTRSDAAKARLAESVRDRMND